MLEQDEPRLAITADITDEIAVVKLRGELDICVRAALAEQLTDVAMKKPDLMVFDLAAVTFIDCGTADLLVSTARRLPSGRKPVLHSACPPVRRLLELSGLDARCELVP